MKGTFEKLICRVFKWKKYYVYKKTSKENG